MQFFLNGSQHKVEQQDANMTLLSYLRTQANLKGTKEGCASGDCGACTVLVGSYDANKEQLVFESINSCIGLLGTVNNKYVISVDGLAKDQLHPAQQAMVDCHGSQCGFCTPGFIMSLAGLYQSRKDEASTQKDEILEAISGNLCRCTGYRPIIDAAEQMFSVKGVELANEEQIQQYLSFLNENSSSEENQTAAKILSDNHCSFFQPSSENELQRLLLEHPEHKLVCGGTDLVLGVTQMFEQHTNLIDVGRIKEMCGVCNDKDFLYIGASTSYSEIADSFTKKSPQFIALLHRLGSSQIRNRGSIGGNIANASPIADTPPVLIAWDAEIEIVDAKGERNWMSLDDFYLDYKKTRLQSDQYIAKLRIPLSSIARPHRFYKISKRFEDDISSVMAAISVELDSDNRIEDIRIAFGGMAAIPKRADKAEKALLGTSLIAGETSEALASSQQAIAEEFSPMTDVRASAEYRMAMAQNLLERFVEEICTSQSTSAFSLGPVMHYQPEVSTNA